MINPKELEKLNFFPKEAMKLKILHSKIKTIYTFTKKNHSISSTQHKVIFVLSADEPKNVDLTFIQICSFCAVINL